MRKARRGRIGEDNDLTRCEAESLHYKPGTVSQNTFLIAFLPRSR